MYKGSGRNVSIDNFFTDMELGKVLNSWNMTLVGTVKNIVEFDGILSKSYGLKPFGNFLGQNYLFTIDTKYYIGL